jgi:hypothetical protein
MNEHSPSEISQSGQQNQADVVEQPLPNKSQYIAVLKRLNEPWAIIAAAIITGIFVLLAAVIQGGSSPPLVTPTNSALAPQEQQTPTLTATWTPLPTDPPSLTPSLTPIPPGTASATPTDTPPPSDTHIPSPTTTSTGTPTLTPTLTDTPKPSNTPTQTSESSATRIVAPATPTPLPTIALVVLSYPCDATIIYNRTGLLNIVRGGPSSRSSYRPPIQQGAVIKILSKDPESRDVFWYRIADANGNELGWIPIEYVVLSASCPA